MASLAKASAGNCRVLWIGCRARRGLAISGGLDLGSALLLTLSPTLLFSDLSFPTLETGAVGQCVFYSLSH